MSSYNFRVSITAVQTLFLRSFFLFTIGLKHIQLLKQKIVENNINSSVYIEDILLFEVNTKYISSNVMKISVNSRVRSTSESHDIFNTCDEIFLVFTEKKVNFFLFFFSRRTNGKQTASKLAFS